MPYPTRYFKQKNFTRGVVSAGEELDDVVVPLDSELKGIETTLNQVNDRLRAITTADGRLKNVADAIAEALAGSERFEATDSQTDFVTDIDWDSTFTSSNVMVWVNGILVDPDNVTVADDGNGKLQVTIAAQSTGTVVFVAAYSAGAGILTRLALTTASNGASLIGIHDVGNIIAATNVEDALQEVVAALNTFIGQVGSLTGYIKADGANDFTGDQSMGDHKLTDLAAATDPADAVRYDQISAYIDIWNDLASHYLALTGTGSGAMTGDINMGNNAITQLADATADDEAVNKGQMDDAIADATNAQFPIGTVQFFAGTALPTGFLECDGSAVSRATYADLFGVIGTTYGPGDSVTTFNLPNFKGRMAIGRGLGDTAEGGGAGTLRTIGDTGGAEDHTVTSGEMPAHTHTYGPGATGAGAGGLQFVGNTAAGLQTTGSTGGGTAIDIMNPFVVLMAIIKY
jgi:microcystin-dependent protein